MQSSLTGGILLCCLLLTAYPVNALKSPADSLPAGMVSWKAWPLRELNRFSIREMQALSGQRYTLRERAYLQYFRWQWKKELKKNPDLTVGEYFERKPVSPVIIILLVLLALAVVGFLVLILEALPR